MNEVNAATTSNLMVRLLFSGLMICPQLSDGGAEIEKQNFRGIDRKIESSFAVVDNRVIPYNSNRQTCDTDNAHILSALAEIGIALKRYEYRVEVEKLTYPGADKKKNSESDFFHYDIEFIDFDYVKKRACPFCQSINRSKLTSPRLKRRRLAMHF